MILFYAFAAVAVIASILVIAQRNPIYSVLLLIASFGALSGLYRSEEHTSELQSHRDLHSFPTRRSSDLGRRRRHRVDPGDRAAQSDLQRPAAHRIVRRVVGTL